MPSLTTVPGPRRVAAAFVAITLATGLPGCGSASQAARHPPSPEPSQQAAAGIQPSTPPATPAPAPTTPAAPGAASSGENAGVSVAAMVEACYRDRPDYRMCTHPASAGHIALPPVVDTAPRPGEVQVVAESSSSYRVISAGADGATWTIQRGVDGAVVRDCDGPSGACPRTQFVEAR